MYVLPALYSIHPLMDPRVKYNSHPFFLIFPALIFFSHICQLTTFSHLLDVSFFLLLFIHLKIYVTSLSSAILFQHHATMQFSEIWWRATTSYLSINTAISSLSHYSPTTIFHFLQFHFTHLQHVPFSYAWTAFFLIVYHWSYLCLHSIHLFRQNNIVLKCMNSILIS